MPKPPHYRGDYHQRSKWVRDQANNDPTTRCWRCGLTLIERHRTHPQARWTAGHLVDGQINGHLAPECSTCNYSNGAKLRHRKRTPLTW